MLSKSGPMIVILTGAGISAESGIATFRGISGLWENHPVESVASPAGYKKDPFLVQRFYNERRRALLAPHIKPNAAHLALARLQREHRRRVVIITQNIDNLHERAGSTDVLHMHGELLKIRCIKTNRVFSWEKDILHGEDCCTCCNATATLRPHIVWFGEMPLYMNQIEEMLSDAETFIAIGTSGQVYPAAGFSLIAKYHGAKTIEVNLEPGENSNNFDEFIHGPASEIVPVWVEGKLKELTEK